MGDAGGYVEKLTWSDDVLVAAEVESRVPARIRAS
jgi:hypothetical protein